MTDGHQERVRFSDKDVAVLAERLGVTPLVAGLSRVESVVLAELSRRPFGLVSSRAVARACSISPASASKATRALVEKNLAVEIKTTVALGKAREVTIVKANVTHPGWTRLLDELHGVRPPIENTPPSGRVPGYLRHAFWNVDDTTFQHLNLSSDGAFIAARALTTGDPNLLSFAASHLKPAVWATVTNLRGLTPETSQTARNLAGASLP